MSAEYLMFADVLDPDDVLEAWATDDVRNVASWRRTATLSGAELMAIRRVTSEYGIALILRHDPMLSWFRWVRVRGEERGSTTPQNVQGQTEIVLRVKDLEMLIEESRALRQVGRIRLKRRPSPLPSRPFDEALTRIRAEVEEALVRCHARQVHPMTSTAEHPAPAALEACRVFLGAFQAHSAQGPADAYGSIFPALRFEEDGTVTLVFGDVDNHVSLHWNVQGRMRFTCTVELPLGLSTPNVSLGALQAFSAYLPVGEA